MALDIQRGETKGPDISEKGRSKEGGVLSSNVRLYMQLLAFGDCQQSQTDAVIAALDSAEISATVYADISDPYGIAVLFWSTDPNFFVTEVRALLQDDAFAMLQPKPEMTMFGRSYSIGYENDLQDVLVDRPARRVTDHDRPWAIWYPLRRSGAWEGVSAEEQRKMLMEHGGIGRAYGAAGHGTDIRLASYGLDTNDNDFVIALIGKDLTALSKIVERMRKTKQTSQFITSLGPFFIGKVIWTAGQ
ncbi:MAG: chlorite dismutase family protein [Candidatus Promineifilaceae bacterium]